MWRCALLAAIAGCSYSPRIGSCAVKCPDGACPNSLTCLDDGFCHVSERESLCQDGGGPIDPDCHPATCGPDQCGPVTDSCGNPATCGCPQGKKCTGTTCMPCTPKCAPGELACGDDGCGHSCGSCPDDRWTCHSPEGVCCIQSGEHCNPFTEGCNCCPGLFCVNGICQPDVGCSFAPALMSTPDEPVLTD